MHSGLATLLQSLCLGVTAEQPTEASWVPVDLRALSAGTGSPLLIDRQPAPLQGFSRLALISCLCVSNLLRREAY